MSIILNFKVLVARVCYGIHPRSIAWEILHARGPAHPVITPLGKGGRLRVRIHSRDVIGKEVYRDGVFEPLEVLLVTRFLQPGMVFFDVGANFGQYTVAGAERVGPTGAVHSFEPSSRMYEELEFNVGLNKLTDRCTLNRVAVSATEGIARLSRYDAGAEVYGSLGNHHWGDSPVVGFEDVATVTLDAYVLEKNIPRVDLIKMDIEGAELPALQGAERLLSGEDAPAVVIEVADINTAGFGYKAMEIWDFLESKGYRIFSFKNRKASLSEAVRPSDFTAAQNLLAVKCRFDKWGIRRERL